MSINGARNFRHRRSPSSDRFLDIFSPTKQFAASIDVVSDELSESEVFWTMSDSAESTRESPSQFARKRLSLRLPDKSGILAALPEDGSRPRAIPRPSGRLGGELTQSVPSRKFQNSAPVNVPPAMRKPRKFSEFDDSYDDENEEEQMLPPHEIVALKLKTTSSSVLEGVGRTLKGRDLRQVRDAVWRQSGFID